MGAAKFVLGSAILGLFWSCLLMKGVLTNSTNRCDYSPCSCDHYGRLTCDCKEEGERKIAVFVEGSRSRARTPAFPAESRQSFIVAPQIPSRKAIIIRSWSGELGKKKHEGKCRDILLIITIRDKGKRCKVYRRDRLMEPRTRKP
ncbi:hypothetical protein HZH68_002385 [Vespula germanica]|uniref:Secreted protein n=1 Tax=Vespula germanica TaxID=30212 RepID=A0A834NM75_VESGE|nr:hypothetical protein HZH68_002385 [Vespula germanica]